MGPPPALAEFGRIGHLTEEQTGSLDFFRNAIQGMGIYDPLRHDDHTLCKFLRARKFSPQDALAMFVKCEEWRRENNIDSYISYQLPSDIVQQQLDDLYPRYYHKTDIFGRPVYIEVYKKLDLDKMMKIINEETFFKLYFASYEQLLRVKFPACSAVTGKNVEQCVSILDLDGVALSQYPSVLKIVKKLSGISSDYYPETLGRMFIVNAPLLFRSIVWPTVSMFMDAGTLEKIEVLKSSAAPERLQVFIPPENLPEQLGGKCKCPASAGGCSRSNEGPWKAHFAAWASSSPPPLSQQS